MNTRRKRASKRLPARSEKETSTADSPTPSSGKISKLASARSALDECVGAICLVEVSLHSLESQEIAFPEQVVLRRALKTIWCVHDWIDELTPNALDDPAPGREDAP